MGLSFMELLLPGLGLLIWTLVAFLIVLYILKKFAWKPILQGLKERETNISEALATAEKVRAEMAAMKNENEAMLAKAREDRAVMIKEAKETGDKMIADAQGKAKTEYERIVNEAQSAIDLQKNAALIDVKNQVGKLVIEIAEKVLRKQLDNKVQQEAFIKEQADAVNLN